MIDINLLPPGQRGSSIGVILGIVAAMTGAVFLMGSIYVYGCLSQAEQSLRASQTAYALLEPSARQQATIRSSQAKIAAKVKILAELSQQHSSGYTFLVSLGYLATDDVWLREVTCIEEGVWLMKGEMTSYQHLVNFMERFSQDTIFAVPEIQQVSADSSVPSFELRVRLRE